uniref:Uncharacterized protein n=1 Tax=Anguilla anguilla TaxID=7936 RepID=A0A0E9SAE8_ANGAN
MYTFFLNHVCIVEMQGFKWDVLIKFPLQYLQTKNWNY